MARFIITVMVCFLGLCDAHAIQVDGDERKLVVLVSMKDCCPDEAWAEAEKATLEELNTIDLKVEVVNGLTASREGWQSELGAITKDNEADCAFRIYKSQGGQSNGIDLWIADQETGEVTFRHIPLGPETDSEGVAIATLRALEAIRAEMVSWPVNVREVEESEPSSEPIDEVENDDGLEDNEIEAEVEPVKEETPILAAGLGVGAAGSPSGAGVLGTLDVTLEWNILPLLSFELDGVLSVLGRDVEQGNLASTFDFALLRGFGHVYFLKTGRFRPSLGLGGGVAFTWAKGRGSDELAAETDRTQVAYLGGSGRVALVLTRNIWLVLGTRVGFLIPEVTVNFGDDEAAAFGRPLIEGFLNLEARFL